MHHMKQSTEYPRQLFKKKKKKTHYTHYSAHYHDIPESRVK